MKAIFCTKYGDPEVLEIREIPIPNPKPNEVLIQLAATSVNSADVRIRGLKVDGFLRIVMRIVLGFNGPRNPILGSFYAGTVNQIGESVTQFKVGDTVFGTTGFSMGTDAEYFCVKESGVIHKIPEGTSFQEAVAVLFGGTTSLHFFNKWGVDDLNGRSVLIYGASGSVGCAAVSIAKHYGAQVTAVCSSRGRKLIEDLGASSILDYEEKWQEKLGQYDVIFDTHGSLKKNEIASYILPKGKFFTVGGLDVADETQSQLEIIAKLLVAGSLPPCIDRKVPFSKIQEAHQYIDSNRKKGNLLCIPDELM